MSEQEKIDLIAANDTIAALEKRIENLEFEGRNKNGDIIAALEAIEARMAALERLAQAIDHRNGRHALPKFQPIGGAGNGA